MALCNMYIYSHDTSIHTYAGFLSFSMVVYFFLSRDKYPKKIIIGKERKNKNDISCNWVKRYIGINIYASLINEKKEALLVRIYIHRTESHLHDVLHNLFLFNEQSDTFFSSK